MQNPLNGYRASKKAAEKASWEFVETEEPNFTLATVSVTHLILHSCSRDHASNQLRSQSAVDPLIFGPVQPLISLDSINASNIRIRDIALGASETEIKGSNPFIWTDVRDVALAHVAAAELPEAANRRFFITAGRFENGEIVDIIRDAFPDLVGNLPGKEVKGSGSEEGAFIY